MFAWFFNLRHEVEFDLNLSNRVFGMAQAFLLDGDLRTFFSEMNSARNNVLRKNVFLTLLSERSIVSENCGFLAHSGPYAEFG